jgi:hypothetical protein
MPQPNALDPLKVEKKKLTSRATQHGSRTAAQPGSRIAGGELLLKLGSHIAAQMGEM